MRGLLISLSIHALIAVGVYIATQLQPPPPRPGPSAIAVDLVDLAEITNVAPRRGPQPDPTDQPAPLPAAAPEPAQQLEPDPIRRPDTPTPRPRPADWRTAAREEAERAGGTQNQTAPPGQRTQPGAGEQTAMSADEISALGGAIRRCYALPPGMRNPQRLRVEMRFGLTRDGQFRADREPTIIGPRGWSQDPQLAAVGRAAIAAARECEPRYRNLIRPGREGAFEDVIIDFGAVD